MDWQVIVCAVPNEIETAPDASCMLARNFLALRLLRPLRADRS